MNDADLLQAARRMRRAGESNTRIAERLGVEVEWLVENVGPIRPMTAREINAFRRSQIPVQDERDLTGRLFGDPQPRRSALNAT